MLNLMIIFHSIDEALLNQSDKGTNVVQYDAYKCLMFNKY